jgi:hypothetical protein
MTYSSLLTVRQNPKRRVREEDRRRERERERERVLSNEAMIIL